MVPYRTEAVQHVPLEMPHVVPPWHTQIRVAMLDRVQEGLPKQYHRRVARLKASPTAQRVHARVQQGGHAAAEGMRHVGRQAAELRKQAAFREELQRLL